MNIYSITELSKKDLDWLRNERNKITKISEILKDDPFSGDLVNRNAPIILKSIDKVIKEKEGEL